MRSGASHRASKVGQIIFFPCSIMECDHMRGWFEALLIEIGFVQSRVSPLFRAAKKKIVHGVFFAGVSANFSFLKFLFAAKKCYEFLTNSA